MGSLFQSILKSLYKFWVSLERTAGVRGQLHLHEQFMHQKVSSDENLPCKAILHYVVMLSTSMLQSVSLLTEWSLEYPACNWDALLSMCSLHRSGQCCRIYCLWYVICTCSPGSVLDCSKLNPGPPLFVLGHRRNEGPDALWQARLPRAIRIAFPACIVLYVWASGTKTKFQQ